MKPLYTSWVLFPLVLTATASVSLADVIYASATMGATGYSSGPSIYSKQFYGSRFHLDKTVQVSDIGGHISGSGTFFGAIVSLSSSNALPTGNPFDATLLGTTLLTATRPSADVRAPLSLTLQPGDYGIVVGSGMYGATGSGEMVGDNQAIAGQYSPFWWGEYTTNTWGWSNTSYAPQYAARFVVDGTVVPEPSTLAILAVGMLGLLGHGLRRRLAARAAISERDTPATLAFPARRPEAMRRAA